ERLEPQLQRALAALLHEHDLPVLRPDAQYVTVVGEVDHAAARALLDFAGEVGEQVVSVDVDPVGRVTGLVALFELLDDVGFAGRGEERRQPVVMLHYLVGDRARLDSPGPPDHFGNAKRAFPVAGLFAAERRGGAVGPTVGV